MKGGGLDIDSLTKLSNEYIKYLFFHYNEKEEWDLNNASARQAALEQYNDDIEMAKKNLKRFFGSSFEDEEIFTTKSINYVDKIDNLFDDFKAINTIPEEAELSNITVTKDEVLGIFNEIDGE